MKAKTRKTSSKAKEKHPSHTGALSHNSIESESLLGRDRFIIRIKCAYCKTLNPKVMFAADWAETFDCEKCGKNNRIKVSFKAVKIEGYK